MYHQWPVCVFGFVLKDDEHIVLEPGDLFPPFSPPPSPRGIEKRGPHSPQQHRLFRVVRTPVLSHIRLALTYMLHLNWRKYSLYLTYIHSLKIQQEQLRHGTVSTNHSPGQWALHCSDHNGQICISCCVGMVTLYFDEVTDLPLLLQLLALMQWMFFSCVGGLLCC